MNAHALLISQGWRGSGNSLHPTSNLIGLSKPLLASRKNDNRGVGKTQHSTSDMWWMNAFDKTLRGLDTSTDGKVVQTVTAGGLDVVRRGGGKWVLEKGGLYANFVKGEVLVGTISITRENQDDDLREEKEEEDGKKKNKKKRKRSNKEEEDGKKNKKKRKRSNKEERDEYEARKNAAKHALREGKENPTLKEDDLAMKELQKARFVECEKKAEMKDGRNAWKPTKFSPKEKGDQKKAAVNYLAVKEAPKSQPQKAEKKAETKQDRKLRKAVAKQALGEQLSTAILATDEESKEERRKRRRSKKRTKKE